MKYIIATALVALSTTAHAASLTFVGDQYSNEHTTTIGINIDEDIMVGIGKDGKFYVGQNGQSLNDTGIVFDKSFISGYDVGITEIEKSKGWQNAVHYISTQLECEPMTLAMDLIAAIQGGECGED